MAQPSVPSDATNRPHWFSDAIGRSEAGVTITDISVGSTALNEMLVRLTVKFDNDYREPKRFYTLRHDGCSWECQTPRKPSICASVTEWLDSNLSSPDGLRAPY